MGFDIYTSIGLSLIKLMRVGKFQPRSLSFFGFKGRPRLRQVKAPVLRFYLSSSGYPSHLVLTWSQSETFREVGMDRCHIFADVTICRYLLLPMCCRAVDSKQVYALSWCKPVILVDFFFYNLIIIGELPVVSM